MATVDAATSACGLPPLVSQEDSPTSITDISLSKVGTPSTSCLSPSIAAMERSADLTTTGKAQLKNGHPLFRDVKENGVNTADVSKPTGSRMSRSFSDRHRTPNSRTPLANSKAQTSGIGQSSTPDISRWRNGRNSKRSLYSSFKFIDDYSPLSSRRSVVDKMERKTVDTPLQQFNHPRHHHQQKEPPTCSSQEPSCSSNYHRRISLRQSVDSAAHSLDVQCGIGPYRPSCLQKFANKNWMLFWLCWFCAVQGMLVSGLVPSVLSSIERRFNFKAYSLGRIMQWYDIGYALCCVPVSYFGGRHSKPLFIGIGLLIMGAGSFIFSMPHIISDLHVYREKSVDIGACGAAASINSANTVVNGVNQTSTMSSACLQKQDASVFGSLLMGTFKYEVIFCFAHLLHGIGATPLFTLGVSYIDENVKPTLSSLYIAIFYTFVIIGPAAGFLMSGAFLRYHTDFLSTEQYITEIDESDPYWVGAWWIGFQIAAILSLFAVFPILSFPKTLPAALEWQRTRQRKNSRPAVVGCATDNLSTSATISNGATVSKQPTAMAAHGLSSNDPGPSSPQPGPVFIMDDAENPKRLPLWQRLLQDLRHMPSAIRRLLTNPSYMCITLAASGEGLLIAGLSGFMAKYLERQFNVASSRANMLIGCIMVPVAGLGTLASGYIVKRFRLTCPQTLKFCIAMTVFSLVLSPMFLVLCEPSKLSGVQVAYPTDEEMNRNTTVGLLHTLHPLYLKSQCNFHCQCSEDEFRPVCGSINGQQVSFFTSCFAGCPEQYHRTRKVYQNCTCVDGNFVTAGWCESKCSALIGFLILFAPMCLCTFSIGVPALSVVLRCVDYNERSFALGIQWILIRCIGTIPAPAIFAWLFDISCLKRRKTAENDCGVSSDGSGSGSDGSCYIYDNKLLADLFLAFALIGQTVTLIFLILASVFYRGNGRDDLIVSEAPPPTPAATNTNAFDEFTSAGGGTPTKLALEAMGKDGTQMAKRVP